METLILALKDAPPVSNPAKMADHVSGRLTDIEPEQLYKMLDAIYSLYYVRELSGVRSSQFLDDVMDGLEERQLATSSKAQITQFRDVLERLLEIDSLQIIAKAARLQRDGERLYCKGKLLSDIRPVFGSDPHARPLGAVLAHTLKIAYHQGREHLEFNVVLDSTDLVELAEVIQRAQDKEGTLRELLAECKLPSFDE
jgi:hypothetical protein